MRDQTRNIVCHAHHVSFEKKKDYFLVLRTSGRLSKQVGLTFITRLSTCFVQVDIFFYTADQLGCTSEPSRENGFKLKPPRYHTTTTRKVVSVCFPVQGHNLINVSLRIHCYLSDHASVLFSLNSNRPPLKTQQVTYRCLKAINIINLNKDLADSSLCYYSPDDIDHLAECYETTLASVIDRQAPLKSKVIVERLVFPGLTMRLKRQSANLEKLSKNGDDQNQLLISTISSEAEMLSTIYCLRPESRSIWI